MGIFKNRHNCRRCRWSTCNFYCLRKSSDSWVEKISSKDDLQTIEEDDLKIFSNTIDTFPPKVVFSGLVQQPHPQRVIYLTRVFNNNMNTPTPSWQASHLCCLVKYLPVVPRYERDIPLGYVLTSLVTYYTAIYHIECDMLWNGCHTQYGISRCDMSQGTLIRT